MDAAPCHSVGDCHTLAKTTAAAVSQRGSAARRIKGLRAGMYQHMERKMRDQDIDVRHLRRSLEIALEAMRILPDALKTYSDLDCRYIESVKFRLSNEIETLAFANGREVND